MTQTAAPCNVGPYTFDEYLELISDFHSYPAPGLIVGGYMVELAKRHVPEGTLFDAISEAASCLPDAIQLLTPCTAGNGWLKVVNLDRYALALFNKYTGQGVRVFLDVAKLEPYPNIRDWYLKRKTKKEQDSDALRAEMRAAGESVLTVQYVQVAPGYVGKSSKGPIAVCPLCREAYPAAHGEICRGCAGEAPYAHPPQSQAGAPPPQTPAAPRPKVVPVEDAVGERALHDMTEISPGKSKGPAFRRGQKLSVGDVCRLQQMGKNHVYVQEPAPDGSAANGGPDWVHEDEAAQQLAAAMCADETVAPAGPPREGKVDLTAAPGLAGNGVLVVDRAALTRFNLLPDVMAASRKHGSVVRAGQIVAGTRAIPLFLSSAALSAATTQLKLKPLFRVAPLVRKKAGLLITGTEVFTGLIQDKFAPILAPKIEALGGSVLDVKFAPDQAGAIAAAVRELVAQSCDMILTTAGLSVDPDDVTRQGLDQAGAQDLLHGAPLLPGSMVLLGRIAANAADAERDVRILGVPACALFHPTTGVDKLLPLVMADVPIARQDLTELAHGGLCQDCPTCVYPHCPFGA